MKRTTLGLAALLLAGLYLLQSQVLEKTKVQRLERASQNLGELPAADLLPTYFGSLFLGAFRAVAIDILWIQMHRMGEEEHRYFERVEYMNLITQLQPRNPEAWAYQGWDAAYNIANQFRTEEDAERLRQMEAGPRTGDLQARIDKLKARIKEKDEQFRKWVQIGILKLVEGCRHLPDDVYLRAEVGRTLWLKAAWSVGFLDEQFLKVVGEDKELQRVLSEGLPPGGPRTAFELSELWFAKGRATLERLIQEKRFQVFRSVAESMSRPQEEDRRHQTTQMGLNIDFGSLDGAIYSVRYLNGILKWRRAREAPPEEAKTLLLEASGSFRKASEQAALYRKLHSMYNPRKRDLHDARVDMCRGLAGLCEDQAKLPHPIPPAERAKLLSRLETIRWNPVDRNAPPWEQIAPPDDRHVLDYMGWLKRSLGGDAWEYNDDLHALHRGNFLPAGERADATIGPELSDVDCYHFYAAPPAQGGHEGHAHDAPEPAARLMTSRFRIKRVGNLTLTVTALAYNKGKWVTVNHLDVDGPDAREFDVTSDREGPVFITVTAKSPAGSAASDRGYWIEALGVQR